MPASYRQGFGRRIMDYYTIEPSRVGLMECHSNVAIRREHVDLARLFADGRQCALRYAIKCALYDAVVNGYQAICVPDAVARHIHPEDKSVVYRALADHNDLCMAYLLDCFLNKGDWQSLSVSGSYFFRLLYRCMSALLRPSSSPASPPQLHAFSLSHSIGLFTGGRGHVSAAPYNARVAPGQVRDRA